jgi:hypothetical protein
MGRQARTGDTVLVKSRERRGQVGPTHCLGSLGEEGVKTTENKIHWPPLEKLIAKLPIYLKIRPDSWTVSSGRKPIKAYWTSDRLHIV